MPQLITPDQFQFRLEFWDETGQRLHEAPLNRTDFIPAVGAACLDGLRRGVFDEYNPPLDRAGFSPRFADPAAGSPRTVGFHVTLPAPDGEHRVEFGSEFFRSRASRVRQDLIRNKVIPEEGKVLYQLAAYHNGDGESEAVSDISVETDSVAVPVRPGSRGAFRNLARWDDPLSTDLPVLIPRRVVDESVEEARRVPDKEIGGVLLGHLRRDGAAGEAFLEITGLVPAEETQATAASVTFTPETWARAREVVRLRDEGEIIAGWVHSHPFRFCDKCPKPTPPECIAKVLFYSTDDEFLMEVSFPQPFMVGLLSAVEPRLEEALGHPPVRLYGWRDGAVCARGFEVFDD